MKTADLTLQVVKAKDKVRFEVYTKSTGEPCNMGSSSFFVNYNRTDFSNGRFRVLNELFSDNEEYYPAELQIYPKKNFFAVQLYCCGSGNPIPNKQTPLFTVEFDLVSPAINYNKISWRKQDTGLVTPNFLDIIPNYILKLK